MRETSVHAPAFLLLHGSLAPSAKLVWLAAQLFREAGSTVTSLAQQSGLSRETVNKGLVQLSVAGWSAETRATGSQARGRAKAPAREQARPKTQSPVWALIPGDLLADPRVGTQAKLLFGQLQLTPGFG